MKIRKGFVSNSSSSSFYVKFDKQPKNENELKQMMFPNYEGEIFTHYGYSTTLDRIVQTVFNDIKDQLADENEDEFMEDIFQLPRNYLTKFFDKYMSDEEIKDYFKKSINRNIFHFEYSNNDGLFFSLMDHGGIFKNIKNIRINKH